MDHTQRTGLVVLLFAATAGTGPWWWLVLTGIIGIVGILMFLSEQAKP